MRLLLASLVVSCLAIACSSFSASEIDVVPGTDGGVVDGGAPDSGPTADASPPAPGSLVPLGHEEQSVRSLSAAGGYVAWRVDETTVRGVSLDTYATPFALRLEDGRTQAAFGIDTANVYWLERGPQSVPGARVQRRPLAALAAPPQTLAEGTTVSETEVADLDVLALGPSHFVTGLSSYKTRAFTKGGTATRSILYHGYTGLIVDESGMTYAMDGAKLGRTSFTTLEETILANHIAASSLVADATTIYGFAQGKVFRIPNSVRDLDFDTGQVDFVPSVSVTGAALLVGDGRGSLVLWRSSDGTLARIDPTTGASTPLQSNVTRVAALAANARGVYWATETGDVMWLTP